MSDKETKNIINDNLNYGIYLYSSDNNLIRENIVDSNYNYGTYLSESNSNRILKNTISNNDYGIYLFESNSNLIYLNCFTNNKFNAFDNGSNNRWDYGRSGNYWDDYLGSDSNGDGIGDFPYMIAGSAKSLDKFPLMNCPILNQNLSGYNIFFLCGIILLVSVLFIIKKKSTNLKN